MKILTSACMRYVVIPGPAARRETVTKINFAMILAVEGESLYKTEIFTVPHPKF